MMTAQLVVRSASRSSTFLDYAELIAELREQEQVAQAPVRERFERRAEALRREEQEQ